MRKFTSYVLLMGSMFSITTVNAQELTHQKSYTFSQAYDFKIDEVLDNECIDELLEKSLNSEQAKPLLEKLKKIILEDIAQDLKCDKKEPETTPEQETKPESPEPDYSTDEIVSYIEEQVIIKVNEEREKVGLPPLDIDIDLSEIADVKSKDMSDNHYFNHHSPTYGSPFEMLKDFGISYKTAGENIARGQTSAEEVVDDWMHSEGHRENILNSAYDHIGVGYEEDGHYWTQLFTEFN